MVMETMTQPMQRTDNNGEICALVKVIIPNAQATFEGSLIGNCDYKTSEYWCYLSPGSKQLKIKYPNCEPLMVNFDSFIGSGVKSKQIYELILAVPSIGSKVGRPLGIILGFEKHGWVFNKSDQWRAVSESIEPVSIYVNLDNGKYDEMASYDPKVHTEMILGNLVAGDVLTFIPESPQYQTSKYTISESDLDSQKTYYGIQLKRTSMSGRVLDNHTGLPIRGITLSFCPAIEYSINYSDSHKSQQTLGADSSEKAVTDSLGCFKVSNLIPNHTYEIWFLDIPVGYVSPNIPEAYSIFKLPVNYKIEADSDPKDFLISPNRLKGYVMDGKKPLAGAKVESQSLFSGTVLTDDNGYFEIPGYLKKEVKITADGYDTLKLYYTYDETVSTWESYAMSIPLKIQMKKSKKSKQREGTYDYIKNKVEFF